MLSGYLLYRRLSTTVARGLPPSVASLAWVFARRTSSVTAGYQPAVLAFATHSSGFLSWADQWGSSGVAYGFAIVCDVSSHGQTQTTRKGKLLQWNRRAVQSGVFIFLITALRE